MLYLILATFFLAAILMVYALLKALMGNKMDVEKRLTYIESMDNPLSQEPELSFGERIIIPFYQRLGKRFMAFSPEYSNRKKRSALERAGLLKNTSYERFVARRTMMVIVFMMLIGLLLTLFKLPPALIFLGVVWAFGFLVIIFRFSTQSAIKKRSLQMVRDLPYTLDLITVSVEAGLSLDGAIGRIVSNIPGVLSEEFSKTLKEMRMGIDKRQALRNMSDRCDVRDLSILVNALIQADELGVSLGKVLRIEGAQLREKRRQAAKEKAMKAPVKILFPMLIFIFPAIFIIILGPAVIHMMRLF